MGRHGGGSFSGKDCTKVDRSASYATRWGKYRRSRLGGTLRNSDFYAIGVAKPISITSKPSEREDTDEEIVRLIDRNFDLRRAIIKRLNLRRPIYRKTSNYGHFGREDADFTWEKLDMAELRRDAGL